MVRSITVEAMETVPLKTEMSQYHPIAMLYLLLDKSMSDNCHETHETIADILVKKRNIIQYSKRYDEQVADLRKSNFEIHSVFTTESLYTDGTSF